jgi:predicted CopG family antitoxin
MGVRVYQKKKNYTYCMAEKLHNRLVKFAKKTGYRSFSDFIARVGQAEIDRVKRAKGDKDDG